jgi:hypothetical protein
MHAFTSIQGLEQSEMLPGWYTFPSPWLSTEFKCAYKKCGLFYEDDIVGIEMEQKCLDISTKFGQIYAVPLILV